MSEQFRSRKPFYKRWWFVILVALMIIIVMVPNSIDGIDPRSIEREKNPSKKETEADDESRDDVSQEYKNALKSAQNYLDMSGFSKKSLEKQLEFEGFSEDSANYALDSVNVDWNEQALRSARVYYENMSMSKEEIFTQLSSDDGEGYTREQARYAVDNLN